MDRAALATSATTTEPVREPWGPHTLVGGHPLWVVGLVLGVAVIVVVWLVARALRILAALVALGLLAAATWVAWRHVFG